MATICHNVQSRPSGRSYRFEPLTGGVSYQLRKVLLLGGRQPDALIRKSPHDFQVDLFIELQGFPSFRRPHKHFYPSFFRF